MDQPYTERGKLLLASIKDIDARFVSANSVPVERVSLRAVEWEILKEALLVFALDVEERVAHEEFQAGPPPVCDLGPEDADRIATIRAATGM